MKTVASILLTSIFFALSIYSCEEESEAPIIVVKPNDIAIDAEVNEVLTFDIGVRGNNALRFFRIHLKPENDFKFNVVDSPLEVKVFSYDFEYRIDPKYASQSLVFEFQAIDVEGNSSVWGTRVDVAEDTSIALVETAGHTFYSSNSSKTNAYNLETNTPVFSSLTDSVNRDLEDISTNDTLSMSWTSPAEGKFVKFQGFDYPNATDLSLRNAYEAGTKLDKVENIQVNDIILSRLGNTSSGKEEYVAIKITGVADATGSENDSYTFNIKKAP